MPVSRIQRGDRVPSAQLGRLEGQAVARVDFAEIVAGKRVLTVGVPGAYTPICSTAHVPGIVANADKLRAAGFDPIFCVSSDNPWVLAAWSAQVDPLGKLTFLSDGNLALARALGTNVIANDYFLGECSARYMLMSRNGVVERIAVEAAILDLTCTRAEDALDLD